jgi:hypothetical protein
MIWEYGIVQSSARLVSEAVQGVVDDYAGGRIREEPDFTSRMLQAIERELNGKTVKGIIWEAVVTTSHGPNTEEKAIGADFMGVLNINLPDYRVSKGFLAQAKLAGSLSGQEMNRLRTQCENMLKLTPESYVFLYAINGVRILPAISVLSARDRDLTELYNRSIQRFFELHFESFIGDRRLSSPSADQLDGLLKKYEVNHILYLAAKQGEIRLE